jgi:hypothetical protein
MRKMWALTLAPLLALAFMVMSSGPANAFGSEVLGCSIDGAAWTAGSCDGGGNGYKSIIEFAPHNTSGTYTYTWTFANHASWITGDCSTTSVPCIYRGCTSTASICDIQVNSDALHDWTYTANLTLSQSGQARTITASALIYAGPAACRC